MAKGMRIINKTDKYGEKNEDYLVQIGDSDLVLSKNSVIILHYNFDKEVTIAADMIPRSKVEALIKELEKEYQKVMDYKPHVDKYDTLDQIEDKIRLLKGLLESTAKQDNKDTKVE